MKKLSSRNAMVPSKGEERIAYYETLAQNANNTGKIYLIGSVVSGLSSVLSFTESHFIEALNGTPKGIIAASLAISGLIKFDEKNKVAQIYSDTASRISSISQDNIL